MTMMIERMLNCVLTNFHEFIPSGLYSCSAAFETPDLAGVCAYDSIASNAF